MSRLWDALRSSSNFQLFVEISCIGCCAYLGVLVRLLLSARLSAAHLTSDYPRIDSSYVTLFYNQPFLVSNMLGSCVNGCLLMWMKLCWPVRGTSYADTKLVYDVAIGISTGFCGCLTTFATWLIDYQTGSFSWDWYDDLVVLGIDFALSWGAYQCGMLMAEMIHGYTQSTWYQATFTTHPANKSCVELAVRNPTSDAVQEAQDVVPSVETDVDSAATQTQDHTTTTPTLDRRCKIRITIIVLFLSSFIVLWSVVIAYSVSNVDAKYTEPVKYLNVIDGLRAIAFAPIGALIRFLIRKWNIMQSNMNLLPKCTLVCNLVGVLIAVCVTEYANSWSWQFPFVDGFLGSLTTVSTMFADIYQLHATNGVFGAWYALRYVCITFFAAIFIVQIIRLGS